MPPSYGRQQSAIKKQFKKMVVTIPKSLQKLEDLNARKLN